MASFVISRETGGRDRVGVRVRQTGYAFAFGENTITSISPVRYLGVMIDYKRNFWDQVKAVAGIPRVSTPDYVGLCQRSGDWDNGARK